MTTNNFTGARRRRSWALGLTLATAVVAALAGTAFACSPRCCVATLMQTSGPAGSRVTVRGTMFGGLTSEIRWASPEGPLLGTATATESDWTRTVTIPAEAAPRDENPAFYSVVVLGVDPATNSVVDQTAPTFKVTGTAPNPSPPVVSPTTQPPSAAPTATQPAPGDSATTQSPTSQSASIESPPPLSAVAPGAAAALDRPTTASRPPAPMAADARSASTRRTPEASLRPAGPFPASPAATQIASSADQNAVALAPPLAAIAPLPQPWAGALQDRHPGLLHVPTHERPLNLGLGALVVGLVGLAGAMGVLGVRRAKATVRSEPD